MCVCLCVCVCVPSITHPGLYSAVCMFYNTVLPTHTHYTTNTRTLDNAVCIPQACQLALHITKALYLQTSNTGQCCVHTSSVQACTTHHQGSTSKPQTLDNAVCIPLECTLALHTRQPLLPNLKYSKQTIQLAAHPLSVCLKQSISLLISFQGAPVTSRTNKSPDINSLYSQ